MPPALINSCDSLQFTKHYFEGSKRFASGLMDVAVRFEGPAVLYTNRTAEDQPSTKPADVQSYFEKYLEKSGVGKGLSLELRERTWSPDLYYLHGDHLGTATFVTNSQSQATQFFLNLPFGETMIEQMDGSYDNPFKFNAKELDEDTSLYYYGARYYNPRLSIWYGVDPLAVYNPVMETEFYGDGQHNGGVYNWGNNNPYIYTYQNPVRYIDPNGKQVEGYQNSEVDEFEMGFAIQSYTWSFIGDARAGALNLASRAFGTNQRFEGDGFFGFNEIPQSQSQSIAGDVFDVTVGLAATKFGVKGGLAQETAGGRPAALEAIKKTASMTAVKKGTQGWNDAIEAIQTQKKSDILVETASDAKTLLLGAQGNLNRYKNYTTKPYKKGYETHNVQNKRELGVGNDKKHLKWKNGKASGHIFYKKPN